MTSGKPTPTGPSLGAQKAYMEYPGKPGKRTRRGFKRPSGKRAFNARQKELHGETWKEIKIYMV